MAKKRRNKVEKEAKGFEIVASDFSANYPHGGKTSKANKRAKTTNTLRDAHKGSGSGGGGSAAARKANELWFRKCGHGAELFAAYYQGQPGLVPPDEWAAFWQCVHTPLPVAFRLNGRGTPARAALEANLLRLGVAAPVPWAADHASASGVWQCGASVTKRTLRTPGQARDVVDAALAGGLLNRQEAVSTLPVCALQCQLGDAVLDLCASPGSKTMQLLDDCCGDDDAERTSGSSDGGSGSGRAALVVANDAHPARVLALMQSLQRHGRSAGQRACLAVTCHRGEAFPAPKRPFHKASAKGPLLGFDKVLADVPCSGDGTVRKDKSVLPRWTPAVGNQLHAVQV
jgi:16S rRNA C967 or C1407 C5-methylase (RsmB/RsmF family)